MRKFNESFGTELSKLDLTSKDVFLDFLVIMNSLARKFKLKLEIDLGDKKVTVLGAGLKSASERLLNQGLKYLKRENGSKVTYEFVGDDLVISLNYVFINNSLRDDVRSELKSNKSTVVMDGDVIISKPLVGAVNLNEKEVIVATDSTIFNIVNEELEKLGYNADLNHIDVSKVTNMDKLFSNSYSENGVEHKLFNGDISRWNVSNVVTMSYMFGFSKFNGDISKWNVSKVTDMDLMFYNSDFNQNIGRWNVSNVVTMVKMFSMSKFNQNISNWDVSDVKDMEYLFTGSAFRGDISSWNTTANSNYVTFNDLKKQKIIIATNDTIADIVSDEIERLGYKANLNHIDVSKVTDMNRLFTDSANMFYHANFDGDISKWDVSNVTNMSFMFDESDFNGDISNWNVSNVKYMQSMFSYSKFDRDISKWDVSNVVNMKKMFENSKFNQNISNWDVSGVYNMVKMFSMSKFNQDVSKWKVNPDNSTTYMFDGSPLAKKLPKWY